MTTKAEHALAHLICMTQSSGWQHPLDIMEWAVAHCDTEKQLYVDHYEGLMREIIQDGKNETQTT